VAFTHQAVTKGQSGHGLRAASVNRVEINTGCLLHIITDRLEVDLGALGVKDVGKHTPSIRRFLKAVPSLN